MDRRARQNMKGGQNNLVDYPSDIAYCVMSIADPISDLSLQLASEAHPDSMNGSILICELVIHRIDVAAFQRLCRRNPGVEERMRRDGRSPQTISINVFAKIIVLIDHRHTWQRSSCPP